MFSSFFKRPTSPSPIYLNKDPLIITNVPEVLKNGDAFFMISKFHRNGRRFIIDFCVENNFYDIALRIDICASPILFKRNSRIKNAWGVDECHIPSWFDISADSNFEIQIYFNAEAILIARNYMHVISYKHRLPFTKIRSVEVNGDLTNINLGRKALTAYPFRRDDIPYVLNIGESNIGEGAEFYHMPFYALLNEKCRELTWSLIVKARLHRQPKLFKIALQVGPNIYPAAIASIRLEFHFNEAYKVSAVSLNSFDGMKWGPEIKLAVQTEVQPNFTLCIIHNKKSYTIRLNNEILYNYTYIVNHSLVSTCFIDGDIELFNVSLEE